MPDSDRTIATYYSPYPYSHECIGCHAPNESSCCCGEPYPLKGDYESAVEGIADALIQYAGKGDEITQEHFRKEARQFLLTLGITAHA